MKFTFCLLLSAFLTPSLAVCQTFYGPLLNGGEGSSGRIYQWSPDQNPTPVADFAVNQAGRGPTRGMIQASDGWLYGTTKEGGACDAGVLYRYNPGSTQYEHLFSFTSQTGISPIAKLFQASDEKIYGTTSFGGDFSNGTIFSYDPMSDQVTVLHHFGIQNDAGIHSALVEPIPGILIGHTTEGGASGSGAIFSYHIASGQFKEEIGFGLDTPARKPVGDLLDGENGMIYGTATGGDLNSRGHIFTYDLNTASFSLIADFEFATGFAPQSSLVKYDQKLYGTLDPTSGNTSFKIFCYDLISSELTIVAELQGPSFPLTNEGGGMILVDSVMIGALGDGPYFSAPQGILYSFDPKTNLISILAEINDLSLGDFVGVPFLVDDTYWIAHETQGKGSSGLFFSYTPGDSLLREEFSFNEAAPVSFPISSLKTGPDNLLYGISGFSDQGTRLNGIYQFDPTLESITQVAYAEILSPEIFSTPVSDDFFLIGKVDPDSQVAVLSLDVLAGQLSQEFVFPDSFQRDFDFSIPSIAGNDGSLYGLFRNILPGNEHLLFSYDILSGSLQTMAYPVSDFSNPAFWFLQLPSGNILGAFRNSSLPTANGAFYEVDFQQDTVTILLELESNDYLAPNTAPRIVSNELLGTVQGTGSNFLRSAFYTYNLSTDSFQIRPLLPQFFAAGPMIGNKIYGVGRKTWTDNGSILMYDVEIDSLTLLHEFSCDLGSIPWGLTLVQAEATPGSELSMNVFPNPAETTVTIQVSLPENSTSDFSVGIYSIEGKLLMEKEVTTGTRCTMDVSQLPSGLYVAKVLSDTGEVAKLLQR